MKKSLFALFLVFSLSFSFPAYADDLDRFLKIPLDAVQNIDELLEKTIFNLGEIRVASHRISSSTDEYATDTPGNVTVIGPRQLRESGQTLAPAAISAL